MACLGPEGARFARGALFWTRLTVLSLVIGRTWMVGSSSCSATSSIESPSADGTGVGSSSRCADFSPLCRFAEGFRAGAGSGESSSTESSASMDSRTLGPIFLGRPLAATGVGWRSSPSSATTRLGLPRLAGTGEVGFFDCLVCGEDEGSFLGTTGVGSDSALSACAGDESSSVPSSSSGTSSIIDCSPITLGVTLAGAGVNSSSSSTARTKLGVAGTADCVEGPLERLFGRTVGVSGGASVDLDRRVDSRTMLCVSSRANSAGAGVFSRTVSVVSSMVSSSGSSGSSSTSSRAGGKVATTLRTLSIEFVRLFCSGLSSSGSPSSWSSVWASLEPRFLLPSRGVTKALGVACLLAALPVRGMDALRWRLAEETRARGVCWRGVGVRWLRCGGKDDCFAAGGAKLKLKLKSVMAAVVLREMVSHACNARRRSCGCSPSAAFTLLPSRLAFLTVCIVLLRGQMEQYPIMHTNGRHERQTQRVKCAMNGCRGVAAGGVDCLWSPDALQRKRLHVKCRRADATGILLHCSESAVASFPPLRN